MNVFTSHYYNKYKVDRFHLSALKKIALKVLTKIVK